MWFPSRALIGASTLGVLIMGIGPAQALDAPSPATVVVETERPADALPAIHTRSITKPVLSHKQRRALKATYVRSAVISVARKQIGDPYVAGSKGPNAFDCSGLTSFVFGKALGHELPRTSREQYRAAKKIPRKEAQPGDLVFFFENGAHHVGIYIGNGKMIDAPHKGERVRVSPISGSWWSRSFTGIGRVLPAV
jgi:cell wall-associated NlpC family hydrolase